MWWKILWGFLTGNLNSIVSAITGVVGKLSDNDTTKLTSAIGAERDVAIVQMQANAAAYHDRVDLMKGMRITQWLIAAALIPPLLHQGMIYIDSTPIFHIAGSWHVPKAPPPYDAREWQMIASLLGIQAAAVSAMSLIKALLTRK